MFALLLWVMTTVAEAAVIENIAFTSRPDARLEVQLTFDEPPSADLRAIPSKNLRALWWICRRPGVR
jgi:hypothetical protein